MNNDNVARASVRINTGPDRVWKGLTDPELIRQYMFGANMQSDWKPGSPITLSGEFGGKHFEDHGTVLEAVPAERLRYTHVSGQSEHKVLIRLEASGSSTNLVLEQDGNADAAAAAHAAENWNQMLAGLKNLLEARG